MGALDYFPLHAEEDFAGAPEKLVGIPAPIPRRSCLLLAIAGRACALRYPRPSGAEGDDLNEVEVQLDAGTPDSDIPEPPQGYCVAVYELGWHGQGDWERQHYYHALDGAMPIAAVSAPEGLTACCHAPHP